MAKLILAPPDLNLFWDFGGGLVHILLCSPEYKSKIFFKCIMYITEKISKETNDGSHFPDKIYALKTVFIALYNIKMGAYLLHQRHVSQTTTVQIHFSQLG